MKNLISKKNIILALIMASVVAINFSFGFPRLSSFSSVDEPYWTYDRTPGFWNALSKGKLKGTNINDKPGITVAIASGIGLPWVNPMEYKSLRQKIKTDDQLNEIKKINFSLRIPIYLISLGMIFFLYFLVKKLFDEKIALLSFILIGLSPILLGVSLIINPDSLLWTFLPASIICYLVFQKEKTRKYLYLSGLFLGLSLLTKYVANILYVYFLILLFSDRIFLPDQKESAGEYLKKSFMNYFIMVGISMLVFFLLFPATWINPKLVLKGTVLSAAFKSTWPIFAGFLVAVLADMFIFKQKIATSILNFLTKYKKYILFFFCLIFILAILFSILNTYAGMRFYNFESIIASPKSSDTAPFSLKIFSGKIFSDFYSLIFGITPIAFAFLIFAILNIFRKDNRNKRESLVILYFIVFSILYYLASTVNHISATVRYQIAIYPLILIVSAIGISQLLDMERIKRYFPNYLAYIILIVALASSLYFIKPFYFSYASSLLPKQYVLNLKDMGDGSYEAARYLNELPNARSLTIWSDKGAVCESFIGRCLISYRKKDVDTVSFDYFVVSSGRKSKSLKMSSVLKSRYDFKTLYSSETYDKKITIGSRPNNFVKVVKSERIKLTD